MKLRFELKIQRLKPKTCNLRLSTFNSQKGVVSLIASIVVGLLLVVITTSAIRVMQAELRQATDFDLSTRAYFAAESGIEDTIAYIRRLATAGNEIPTKSACTPTISDTDFGGENLNSNLSGDGVIAYTCQTISVNQTELTGELNKEASTQIDLPNSIGYNGIKISWSQSGTTDPSGWSTAAIPLVFPPGSGWTDVYPAVLETNFITYPTHSPFDSSEIESKTIVLKPNPDDLTSGNIQFNSFNPTTENPETVKCIPATPGSYDCEASFGALPSSKNIVLRLTARYSATHYKIELTNGGNPVEIPGSQIIIDVTGKAGDVYRRIQARGYLNSEMPFPYAILTDQDICKVLEVTAGSADSDSGCNP